MQASRIKWLLGCLFLLLVMPQITWAGGTQTIAGVTVTTPVTYSSCVDENTFDVITVSGLNGRRIVGQFIVEYVVGDGRLLIEEYPINTTQDFSLPIEYPPVSVWPAVSESNSTREIHVDVQLELIDYSGAYVSIGAGLDWDVFCIGLPPPPPPPPGQFGCTPGYWKNHKWWATNTLINSVFSNTTLYVPANDTVLKALAYKGGPGNLGAAYILLRASAAAWLNSVYLNYPLSTAQLQNEVNAALASQDRATMLLEATKLDIYNNLGCPLN